MPSRVWALAVLACLVLPASTAAQEENTAWRPVVMGTHGMVAAGHYLASMAGVEMLKDGGNAVDAAVATWFVQGLVEPEMTGLGGDAFILIYLAETGEVKFINATGPAPQGATPEFYRARGGIPLTGVLSSDVPGALDGIGMALERYGTLDYDDVLAPAIDIAANGYPVSHDVAERLADDREDLERFPSTTGIWFRDGRPLRAGEVVVQRGYAGTLEQIAAQGRRVFYEGEVARTTARFMERNGGILSYEDLATYRAHEADPIHINYRGEYEVYEAPPNSQGHVLLQALNIVEGFSLKYMGHNSAPYLHAVTEALKLSFADRNAYVGDPRFVPPIPIQGLLSKEYAAERRALIDPHWAIEGMAPAGTPARSTDGQGPAGLAYAVPDPAHLAAARVTTAAPYDDGNHGLTTYLAVIDEAGNMVSITSSLCSGWGSGVVMGEAGYFMNNRMVYYFLDPDNINVLVPGKRTRHTINPALALKNGQPFMAFGTPGGDTQPQTELQFFLNLVEFDMNVQEALEAPAVISSNFPSSFWPHRQANKLRVPVSLPAHVREELAAKGHDLDVRDYRGVGRVKAVIFDPDTGVFMGGVSPVGDSYVIGW